MVAGITVKNVPSACTKQDLTKHFKSRRHGGGTIDYVLYPLFGNEGEAFVAFQDSKGTHLTTFRCRIRPSSINILFVNIYTLFILCV